MTTIRLIIVCIVWVGFIGNAWCTNAEENRSSVSVALGEWPPFISEELPGFGSVSRIVNSAFKSQGLQVKTGFFPWKRSYDLTRIADWDATAVWVKSPERERRFLYSDPVMISHNVLFYRKDKKFDWKTLEDLEGYVIGGSTGYYYGSVLETGEKLNTFRMERIPDEAANFKKLLIGRVDLVVSNKEVGYFLINSLLEKKQRDIITHHPKSVHLTSYHLIIGKKNPRAQSIMRTFNQGLGVVLGKRPETGY